jgi:phosphate transport system substrate-binding protein
MNLYFTKVLLPLLTISSLLTGLVGCTNSNSSKAENNASALAKQEIKEIKIGGSSSTYPIMKLLSDAYTVRASTTKVNFATPSQSETAIAGVKEGIFDVASISKQVKPEERDSQLDYYEVAKDGLLVATHPSVKGVANLTTDNLKAIYSGKITNWKQLGGPSAKIVVLDRPEDESAKKLLRKHYLGDSLKNSPNAVVMRKENDLITAIQNTQYSIGAFSLGYAVSNKLAVNKLNLDGVEPTIENINNNKYKMVRSVGLVAQKKSKLVVKEMIDFALSVEGNKVISESGFAPTNPL